ncbi:PIN domain-containing protein [bacterium]|nr:PIN domain-containing protein [bacterium]
MKLLLDTHAFLWFVEGSDRISRAASAAIADPKNELFLSVASIWEMAIKIGKRKLVLDPDLETYIDTWTREYSIKVMPIEARHTFFTSTMNGEHGDPFDRMLVSQAILENMMLVSGDRIMPEYPVSIVW